MEYNLWNESDVKKILLRDKYNILKGICAEQIFIEDVLPRKEWNEYLSTGWWAVPKPRYYGEYILFIVSSHDPTPRELSIINFLINKKIDVYYAKLNQESNLEFLHMNTYTKEDNKGQKIKPMNLHDFLVYMKIDTEGSRDPLLAVEEVRNTAKQMEAIEFIQGRGLLYEIGLQRYFANFILTVYFGNYIINLDGFLFKDNKLILLEVKFKFPAANKKYGLNIGFVNWFKWVLRKGMSIYHIILYNGTYDENITILDAINNEEIKDQCKWLFCEINDNHLSNKKSIAPSKTHIEGKAKQGVTYIDQTDFIFVKKLLK
ncbi:hypothetical protein [Bacillus sp. AFS017274]|uniref:hypothetical protein n=1 Tax=Bacillus sp. AFS017274 TaxID=2033488 RepID=UPI000BF9FB8D|nr:hypothetical protein [Bacillus sp. AFS017274]PEZ76368.1 hypothetical protein CN380_21485 [Bacillus sp. AFS017274]